MAMASEGEIVESSEENEELEQDKHEQEWRAARRVANQQRSYAKKLERVHVLQETLRRAKELCNDGTTALVSVDVEVWERQQRCITEIGISVKAPAVSQIESYHWRVKEWQHLRNGLFVDDNADRFEKEFGESRVLPLVECIAESQRIFDCFRAYAIVAHSGKGDMTWLARAGLQFHQDASLLDTKEIFCAFAGEVEGRKLNYVLDQLRIVFWNLHNAGNDARYTLEGLLRMANDPPLAPLQVPLLPAGLSMENEVDGKIKRLLAGGAVMEEPPRPAVDPYDESGDEYDY